MVMLACLAPVDKYYEDGRNSLLVYSHIKYQKCSPGCLSLSLQIASPASHLYQLEVLCLGTACSTWFLQATLTCESEFERDI